MAPQTFRKKPVEIQAMRFLGGPEEATPIIDWVLTNGGTARWHEAYVGQSHDDVEGHGAQPEYIAIDTLEGTMRAERGWWVIRGVAGEFYPCKPEIFAATYEPA